MTKRMGWTSFKTQIFFDAIQIFSRTEQSIEAINRQPPKDVRLNNCGTPKSETGGVFPSGRAGGCRVWTMWTGGCRARQTVLRAEIAYVCKLALVCGESQRECLAEKDSLLRDEMRLYRDIGCKVKRCQAVRGKRRGRERSGPWVG